VSWFDTALSAWYRSKEQERAINARGLEQAGEGLAQGLQQARQNSIADAVSQSVANSGAYAPRAGLVSPGTNPITGAINSVAAGVPTAGTAPISGGGGGMLGFQLRNAMANQGIENALKRAQIGYYGAHGASAIQNAATQEAYRQAQEARLGAQTNALNTGGGPQGAADRTAQAAALKQAQKDAQANYDDYPRIYKDLKDIYGADADKWLQGLQGGTLTIGRIENGQWITDPKGTVASASPTLQQPPANKSQGVFGIGANPGSYSADDAEPHAPIAAMQPFLDRTKRVISAPNNRFVPPVVMPAQAAGQPAAQAQGGDIPTFQTPDQARQSGLPSGSPFKNPAGQVLYMP